MMKRYQPLAWLLLIVTVACGVGLAGMAALAPLPQWEPGFYWKYANETRTQSLEYWVLGVRAIRGLDHHVLAQIERSAQAEEVSLAYAPLRAPYARSTNTPETQTYLAFPLEVGLAWTVREAASAGILSAAGITAQVQALAKVETGFGTFDAFRVDYERGSQRWSLWYAPHAQNWVKQTSPVDGSFWLLEETWRFTGAYALDAVYRAIEAQLTADSQAIKRVLEELVRFDFDGPRAQRLLSSLPG